MKKLLSLILMLLCLLLIFTSCGNKDKQHEVVEVKKVDATCTSIGYTEYHCDHCDQNYISDFVDALGHVYGEAVAVTEADCTTRGVYESTCARCGDVQRYSVSAKGHSYVEITSDDATVGYECEACHDVINIASDERIEDYIGATEIFDVEPTFTFDVVSSEGEEHVKANLKIIDSYFNGTEYENDADSLVQYVLTSKGNNIYTVSVPEKYLYDTTYIAKLSGGVTFAEYKSKELSFTVTEDPNHENVYEYNSEIVFLKALENANGGYYPYDITSSEDGDKLYLIVNKIDGLSKGHIVCVGDVDSMSQITSDTECYFGIIGDSYQLTDGRWLVTLSEPELEAIFNEFDIAFNEDVDLSNANFDTAAIEDGIIESLYASDEFIEFLSAVKVSSENYINANGYYSPNLIDTKTFLNSVSIDPEISFGGNTLKLMLHGLIELDINDSNGAKIGTLAVEFDLDLKSQFKIDVNYDIKTQWKGIKLEKFDVAMTQSDDISFGFRVSVDSDAIRSSGYVINKKTGEAHLACCVEVTRASDPAAFETATLSEVQAAEEKCSRCKPENGASLENDFNGYYMNTLYCSDWEKVAADIGKLTQTDKKSSRLEVELGSVEIPICGPVSANIGIGFAISFDAKAIMDYSYSYAQTSTYGMRLNHDYLQPYSKMSNSNVSQNQLAVLGKIEARVGLLVDTYINISGLEKWINAGVKADVGTYAELSGVIDTAYDYHGAYFEIGAYLDIDAYYKIIRKDGTTDLAEIKKALKKFGYEKLYFAYEKYEEKLNILGSYDIAANDILAVRYYDLVNMVIKTDELSLNERSKYKVNISFADGTYCEIKDGVIVYKTGAPRIFSDTLIITVTSNDDWKTYKKGSAVYYLGTYEIDFEFDTNHTHTWVDATCTAPKTCSGCGATEGAALGHSWKDATCTIAKTCTVCGATEGTALGHSWKSATCTVAKTCTVCGATEGAALGHSWKSATCTAPKTCSGCGKTDGVALGHSWNNATCTAPQTCGTCGATTGSALVHSWTNATCTSPKACKNCGATEGVALGHSWKDATCTAPKICSGCGLIEGEALGHNWIDATCSVPKTCTVCGTTTGSTLPHTVSDWIIDKEPTNSEYGSKHTECTVCGQLVSVLSIYPTGSEGLEFTLNSDGQSYSVSGIGTCIDKDLIIPATYNGLPVTNVGDKAFSECRLFTSVTIPDSVTSIGVSAFQNIYSLTKITIGNSVTSIGDYAFYNCDRLSSVAIPNSVTSIGEKAFYDCKFLKSIVVPDSVTSIGDLAFSSCDSLQYNEYDKALYLGNDNNPYVVLIKAKDKSITNCEIHSLTRVIYHSAFSGCASLSSVLIPNSVTSIGSYAFNKCTSLASITMGNSVFSIGNYAFNESTSLTSIIIPDSVASVGDYAFYNCTSLTSVLTGNSMRSIGDYAFYGCKLLTSIVLPDSMISIGNCSFCACKSLESITIPNSVTSIGNSAFASCTSLSSAKIGNSVTSMGDYVFTACSSLTSVIIGNSVMSIGKNAFYNCKLLTSVTIPDSVKGIDDSAFSGCTSLASVTMGNSIMSIGNSAFSGCSLLTNISIPDSVTSIGNSAFSGCSSLTSVTIGNSITSIGSNAFNKCTSIKNVYYTGDIKSWLGINFNNYISNPMYNGSDLYFEGELVTNLVIPDSTTSIGNYAFYSCKSLASITIPDSVTYIGDYAFYWCNLLTSVAIPNSVTSIGDSAFESCTSLTSVTIPDSVTNIGEEAFHSCKSLTSITIPDSVTSIGDNTFRYCTSLTSITIPDSVTSLGYGVFEKCTSLTDVYYTGNVEGWIGFDFIYYTSNPMYYGAKLYFEGELVTSITIPNSVTTVGDYTFSGCTSLTSVTIPDSVTSIGSSAFYSCTSLTSVTIPDSVTSIGNDAFRNCTSLTSITIPDSVTGIDNYAFQGCSSLASITIPDSVTSIGIGAFSGCTGLKSITISASLISISDYTFSGCTLLASVTIPDSVKSIGIGAFSSCTWLRSIIIPDSVTSIGESAFHKCNNLTEVIIPSSVTSVGRDAFRNCSSLTIYCEAESQPSGWSSSWNYSNRPVVWGYKPEQND
ncbi:MAG: leucine-rich repeat domain-containing protein [Clostridia bacterium]|nr:leucine-rich repeat domain-containing protein [Clostridia bacterium]